MENRSSPPGEAAAEPLPGKWRNIVLLAIAEALAMGLWFSASAALPQLTAEWRLDAGLRSWITMSVQAGFVCGALFSAVTNLSDRVPARHVFAISALLAALATAAITLPAVGPRAAIALRFLTGVALAGVYPPGMKLVATWCQRDRGLGIGILVGALTLGKAFPHLLNAVLGASGMPPWRSVLNVAALAGLVAAAIAALWIRSGPYLARTAPFDWRFVPRALAHRPTRLANFGYLGHMWELYAMWAWVPIFLLESYRAAGLDPVNARLAGFVVLAVGAIGSILAGQIADRFGRTQVANVCMAISGSAALVAGFAFDRPMLATLICVIWGFAVVADSAQFSAAVSELTDPRYVGTALTLQTAMGFLLTLATLRLVPWLVERFDWAWTFPVLALGPAFGILSMRRLGRFLRTVK